MNSAPLTAADRPAQGRAGGPSAAAVLALRVVAGVIRDGEA